MMFDKHLVDEALHGAGCEVVDIVLDIPSLIQVVDGREDRRRETIRRWTLPKLSRGGWLGRAEKLGQCRFRAGAVTTNLV
jgi:hypothetical protein